VHRVGGITADALQGDAVLLVHEHHANLLGPGYARDFESPTTQAASHFKQPCRIGTEATVPLDGATIGLHHGLPPWCHGPGRLTVAGPLCVVASEVKRQSFARILRPGARNAQYPLAAVLPSAPLVQKTWSLRGRLDQGQDSSCVGCGWSQRLNSQPHTHSYQYPFAHDLYIAAQRLDAWPGEEPSYQGTSVLAGAKAVKARGLISVYRWAASLDEILLALAHEGPVVAGTPWLQDMFQPDAGGFLRVSGKRAGGHCWLLRGVDPSRERVRMSNSWGTGWSGSLKGDAWITFADLQKLVDDGSEWCVPTER
jgi:hypothetical protein